ncbi:MAG TPA: hypothetical protein VMF69_22960 [Gemmataceae bacterium]|nr:hypothetical protein [Gemmataceae bacterium]
MTEKTWLRFKKSLPLLKYLRDKVSDRKMWLFVAAFWRNASKDYSEKMCRLIANLTEKIAYQSIPLVDCQTVFNAIQEELESLVAAQDFESAAYIRDFRDFLFPGTIECWRATGWRDKAVLHAALLESAALLQESQRGFRAARWITHFDSQSLSGILRDIMGNPFRPASLASSWLTWHSGLIVSMARQIYELRIFDDMLILADALEEAGCTNADILNHCRQPGEHVRGCWVIDLLLGKE